MIYKTAAAILSGFGVLMRWPEQPVYNSGEIAIYSPSDEATSAALPFNETGAFVALRAHIFGIANVTAAAVEAALIQFALQRGGTCAPTIGTAGDFNILAVTGALDTHASVFVRWPQWWDVRDHLMHRFDEPFLAFAVYEHDFWFYELFIAGNRIDSFNPNPAFWNGAPEVEPWPSVGNPSVLCQYWPNIMATSIQNYFEPWTIEGDWYAARKAYPDDRFQQGEVLQVSDFMRRLNLICPVGAAEQLYGNSYTLAIPTV